MNELLRPESQQDGLSRLVVTYEIKDTGEVFNWGMAGEIPAQVQDGVRDAQACPARLMGLA